MTTKDGAILQRITEVCRYDARWPDIKHWILDYGEARAEAALADTLGLLEGQAQKGYSDEWGWHWLLLSNGKVVGLLKIANPPRDAQGTWEIFQEVEALLLAGKEKKGA